VIQREIEVWEVCIMGVVLLGLPHNVSEAVKGNSGAYAKDRGNLCYLHVPSHLFCMESYLF
jgi:hypothetical protein